VQCTEHCLLQLRGLFHHVRAVATACKRNVATGCTHALYSSSLCLQCAKLCLYIHTIGSPVQEASSLQQLLSALHAHGPPLQRCAPVSLG
jgi:hypothetical protein